MELQVGEMLGEDGRSASVCVASAADVGAFRVKCSQFGKRETVPVLDA